jgi:16S rRNA (uracil1498-N3)-methyltransferase
MNLFYHNEAATGKVIVFDPSEGLHISKVLRKNSGDVIHVTDGLGFLYQAILDIQKKETRAEVLDGQKMPEGKAHLELAVAPTKNNERLEWFVEKAVEIGVHKISLILCEHSERPHLRIDRLQKVAISAMKQSLKFYLPEITELIKFKDWVQLQTTGIRCIAHCNDIPERTSLMKTLIPNQNATIAIGPEGDFSKVEIDFALSIGFKGVHLGNSRLRTETAALAAVHTFELVNQ